MKIQFHAEARDEHGYSVREPDWHDMDQYADVKTIEEAREWAARAMAQDSRIAWVDVRETVQDDPWSSWRPGKHVERISREGHVSIQRCDAYAQRGSGSGICDRPLDKHGYCDRASDHIDI